MEAPEDLSQYGLEEPFRTITAVLSDGTQVVIYAGNKSDLLSEYYIKVEGDDNVYLVSSTIVTDFDKDPEDFIDETETETATEETADRGGEGGGGGGGGRKLRGLTDHKRFCYLQILNHGRFPENARKAGALLPLSGHFLCHQADDLIHFQLFLRCCIFADRHENGRNFRVGKADRCFSAFLCQRHQKRQ